MSYSKKQNEYNKEYVKEHQKQIVIKYKKDDYEQRIHPVIKESGLPVATFIKQAIEKEIESLKGKEKIHSLPINENVSK